MYDFVTPFENRPSDVHILDWNQWHDTLVVQIKEVRSSSLTSASASEISSPTIPAETHTRHSRNNSFNRPECFYSLADETSLRDVLKRSDAPIPSSPSGRAADAPWNTQYTSASRILGSLDMQIIPILQTHHENNPGLLDSSLNHSVLAGFMAGAGHVALEDQRRLNFVKLLKEAMILREHMCAVIQRPVVDL